MTRMRAAGTHKIEPKRAPRNTLRDERGAAPESIGMAAGGGGPAGPPVLLGDDRAHLHDLESRAFTPPSAASSSSLQRGSGAPLTYQALPLSARSIPYVFIAFRITCTFAG